MKTFEIKKILVPIDFSETGLMALDHATYMAQLFKARLFLLHVVEVNEYAYSEYEPEIMFRDANKIDDAMAEKLEKLGAQLSKRHGINVQTLLGNGKPASGISDAVTENDIDIIVMGTHGAKGFEEYFIGSNAHKTINASTCPVITIQAHAKSIGFTNIVMPIDNSQHSRQKVDYVIKLASQYGAKVHILGLLDSSEETDEKKFNIKMNLLTFFKKKEFTNNFLEMCVVHYLIYQKVKQLT